MQLNAIRMDSTAHEKKNRHLVVQLARPSQDLQVSRWAKFWCLSILASKSTNSQTRKRQWIRAAIEDIMSNDWSSMEWGEREYYYMKWGERDILSSGASATIGGGERDYCRLRALYTTRFFYGLSGAVPISELRDYEKSPTGQPQIILK